jgi:hypothetical protein
VKFLVYVAELVGVVTFSCIASHLWQGLEVRIESVFVSFALIYWIREALMSIHKE